MAQITKTLNKRQGGVKVQEITSTELEREMLTPWKCIKIAACVSKVRLDLVAYVCYQWRAPLLSKPSVVLY